MQNRNNDERAAHKKPAVIIHPEDFPCWLAAKIGDRPVTEIASQLGVTVQHVYMMLRGERQPGSSILGELGLQIYYGAEKRGGKKR